MKKSNALMLSYMIFLVIAVVAQIFFSWNGLDQIAIAATIAGCFFAFADLVDWYISYQTNFMQSLKRTTDLMIAANIARIETIDNDTREFINAIELLAPYKSRGLDVIGVLEKIKTTMDMGQRIKLESNDIITKCRHRENEFMKKEKKIDCLKKCEISLVMLGFVAFFVLISFQHILSIIFNYQSFATVIAFFIIMLTYYLRDVIEEKHKGELEEILNQAEEMKNDAYRQRDEANGKNLLNQVEDMLKKYDEFERLKNET